MRRALLLSLLAGIALVLMIWAIALLSVRERPDALAWWIPGGLALAVLVAFGLAWKRFD